MFRFFSSCMALFVFACTVCAHASSTTPREVTIHARLYTLSDHYEIESEEGFQGNLVKSRLALRTSYEYYDQNGELASAAYLRVFSLGSIYTWAGVLDIYANDGSRIGLIEGAIMTLLPSKFSFY